MTSLQIMRRTWAGRTWAAQQPTTGADTDRHQQLCNALRAAATQLSWCTSRVRCFVTRFAWRPCASVSVRMGLTAGAMGGCNRAASC
jgi:hypothetical protein